MRLFLALELAEDARQAAAQAAADLRARLERTGTVDARWTPPQNLHVTLWFLGEVGEAGLAALEAACAMPLPVAPFTFVVTGAGVFPPAGPPRVVWFGVEEGRERIAAVHQELARRLVPLGYPPETRPFTPHITVARMRTRPPAAVSRELRLAVIVGAVRAAPTRASAVTVYQSRLSPRGAAYTPMLRVPLGG